MGFSYELTSSDPTKVLVAKVRLELGDQTFGYGVKPDGTNFSDEEIEYKLLANNDHVFRTVADFCSVLARSWAQVTDITVGPRKESLSKISAQYEKLAERMGASLGTDATSFSTGLVRDDGYANS